MKYVALAMLLSVLPVLAEEEQLVFFNRAPLSPKPYAELPLGAIEPQGWLRDELQRMAVGMTGHLDEWYPEVCGDRNAWLGGDGDTWERGPYWIDGLYPLAKLLRDKTLEAKAMKWIEWTLNNQRPNGQIGPVELKKEDRTQPPPAGAQIENPEDWWPRMVMLKILQQHYQATGDQRVVTYTSTTSWPNCQSVRCTIRVAKDEPITLIPYGATILRTAIFPWIGGARN